VSAKCVLGIDYGTVRVGLAVSDPDRKFAFPLATYNRQNRALDEKYFCAVAAEQEIAEIVVGLPIHLSGQEGQKAAEARNFGQWLASALRCPVVYWDERFTTVEAENHLLAAGLTNKRRKARRDRVAAQILLQSYLDAGCPGTIAMGPLNA
jgi:putative Holliday junction resolvase